MCRRWMHSGMETLILINFTEKLKYYFSPSKSRSSSTRSSGKKSQGRGGSKRANNKDARKESTKPKDDEPINPGLLARITSDD